MGYQMGAIGLLSGDCRSIFSGHASPEQGAVPKITWLLGVFPVEASVVRASVGDCSLWLAAKNSLRKGE